MGSRLRAPRTLRGRLALVALATTAVVVAVLTVLFNVLLHVELEKQADEVLAARADAAVASVQPGPDGRLQLLDPEEDDDLDAATWVYEAGTAVVRPRARPSVQRAADGLARVSEPTPLDLPGSPETRMLAAPVRVGGQVVGTVVCTLAIEPYRRAMRDALLGSSALALLLVAAAYVVTRLVVRRALVPVVRMADRAATWGAEDSTQRFGPHDRPRELADLAAALDALLDRIGSALHHEQLLAAEISRELRTPLTVLGAETQLLLESEPDSATRTRVYRVIADSVDRMGGLVESILAQAGHDALAAPGRCTVRPVVESVVDDLCLARPDVEVRLDVPDDLEVGVTTTVLERVLGPIVGNAARYAAQRVSVEADFRGDEVVLSVRDDGPGVPHWFRESVVESGTRPQAGAHPDATGQSLGQGLGLALARRLARTCGGDLDAEDCVDGAAFLVRLPAVPPSGSASVT